MSRPFAQRVGQLAAQRTDEELTAEAFGRFNRWALLSTNACVSLDEVAWVAALMVKAMKVAGHDMLAKTETGDANGARVVGVVASDGVQVADGAA